MSDMKWTELKQKRCPKCRHALTRTEHGFECQYRDPYYGTDCKFFITHKRFEEITDRDIRLPRPTRA